MTQYLAIAIPALIIVAFQDRIAEVIMGPSGAAGAPIVGLTPGLLLGYGVFYLLGFALFALIYAAMGSFVSRPDDLQTLSLPLSLVAMAGYLMAVVTLSSGGSGTFTSLASFIPPFSPLRDARPADDRGRAAVAGRAVDRAPARRDRRSGGDRDPDVRGRRPAVRATAGTPDVHRRARKAGDAVVSGLVVEREAADQGQDRSSGGGGRRKVGLLG